MSKSLRNDLIHKINKSHNKGQISNAKPLLKQAMRLDPNEALLWAFQSEIDRLDGKPNKALENIQKSLQIKQTPDALWLRAALHNEAGRILEAIEDTLEGIKTYPQDMRFTKLSEQIKDILISKIDSMFKQEQFIESKPLVEQAMRLDENNPYIWLFQAGIHYILGDHEKEREAIDKSIEIEPSAQAFYTSGYLYVLQGKFGEAEKELQKGLYLEPNNWLLNELRKLLL